MGSDGFFVADQLVGYTAMAREAGWGKDFPEMLRNEDWNYAVFTPAKGHRPGPLQFAPEVHARARPPGRQAEDEQQPGGFVCG